MNFLLSNGYVSGILTGLAVAVLLAATRRFYIASIVPIIQHLTSRGHNISGRWESMFPAKHDHDLVCSEDISIYQRGNKVRGSISYAESHKDQARVIRRKRFEFEGRYEDRILVATYWNADRCQIGIGTFTLQTNAEGNRLAGKYSWLDPDTGQIEADDYTWSSIQLATPFAELLRPIDPFGDSGKSE